MDQNGLPVIEDYCLWELEESEFTVGIIGTGPGLRSILEIITNQQYLDFLPSMKLVGVAEPGPNKAKLEHVKSLNIPIFDTVGEMLAAHPRLDLIFELVGSRFKLRNLRERLGEECSLIDHKAAVFFCGLHNMLQAGQHCQMHLTRHKVLLEAIIDQVRDDILLLDAEGRVMDLNRHVSERLGKEKSELIGMPCCKVQLIPDSGEPFCERMDERCPFHETVKNLQPAEALMTRVGSDGSLRYFRVYSYPILSPKGRLTHVLVMRRDITSRTYRERLQQQQEKLSIVGEISSHLAHEIRNPLFTIAGFANNLLRSGTLSDKDREKAAIIAEETKRLEEMLSSILKFIKPTIAGLTNVDLNQAVEDALAELGLPTPAYAAHVDASRHLPLVRGEPEMIKQSIVNLLRNSLEAMPDGGDLHLTTGMIEDMAFLTVEDTGQGMSEEEIKNAFSPFYTSKKKGYGLGLAMIRKIVEEFGGHVEMKSRPNEGATVTILLPPVLAV